MFDSYSHVYSSFLFFFYLMLSNDFIAMGISPIFGMVNMAFPCICSGKIGVSSMFWLSSPWVIYSFVVPSS